MMSEFDRTLPIGTIAKVYDREPVDYLTPIAEYGMSVCQLGGVADNLLFGPDRAERVADLKATAAKLGVTITAVWIPFRGQLGDFYGGPKTLGLVPEATRAERMVRCCMTSELAKELGVDIVAAHVGFVPDHTGPFYEQFVNDMRIYLEFCRNLGQTFIFETGQESVDTLERLLTDLAMPNIGLNFDPANLLIYNFDDPGVLVERLAKYVKNTHIKDGCRPTVPARLGTETLVGEGDARVAELVKKLYHAGYRGPLIIEREIAGDQQRLDILKTCKLLNDVKKELLA